jgi:hypothetical protein
MSDRHPLMPADTPSYMAPAWLGLIDFAIQEPAVVAEFRRQTGNNWKPSADPFVTMVDEATGADKAFIEQFIGWVNVNLWGPIDGPLDESA